MGLSFVDVVVAKVGGAHHQCRRSVNLVDDCKAGKAHSRSGPRKAGENNSRHDREEKDSERDLDDDNHVRIKRYWIEIAVTDGRDRLDAEEEGAPERRRINGRVGGMDGCWVEPVKLCEQQVETGKARNKKRSHLRPAKPQQLVVDV